MGQDIVGQPRCDDLGGQPNRRNHHLRSRHLLKGFIENLPRAEDPFSTSRDIRLLEGGLNDPEINCKFLSAKHRPHGGVVGDLDVITKMNRALDIELVPFDLLSARRWRASSPRARRSEIDLRLKGSTPPNHGEGPGQDCQVLTNLIVNSINWLGEGHEIRYTTPTTRFGGKGQRHRHSESHLARVFERFYRGQIAQRHAGGSGLGWRLSSTSWIPAKHQRQHRRRGQPQLTLEKA